MAELTGPNTYELTVEEFNALKQYEAENCRMREVLEKVESILSKCGSLTRGASCTCDVHVVYFDVYKALASTAPCQHAAEVAELRLLCGEAAPYVAGKRFRWEMGSTILADDLARDLKDEAAKGGGK